MSDKHTANERRKGASWFNSLDRSVKGDFGDEIVLRTFDWRDWGFEVRPSSAFLDGADDARTTWEQVNS